MKTQKNNIEKDVLRQYKALPATPRNKYKQAVSLLSPKTVSLLPSDELTDPIFYSWTNRAKLYAHLRAMGWRWRKSGRWGYWSDGGYWVAQIPF